MSKKKIQFMCTAFRDGFQSVYGARVFTKDYLPAIEAARDAGIRYFEAGGGAMFQSLYFYCREDAFAAMDAFRRAAGPEANLQTLARGVNVVGLESQPADVIDLHARLFKRHGITTIRNFDALNDVNNLIHSGRAIVAAGLKHQVSVAMMELPPGCVGAHGPEFYANTLQQILDAGIPFDSVCFKDASGTSAPAKVRQTIALARKLLPEGVSLHFHTHDTAGVGVLSYREAIEAGADTIDLSLAPCSGGTCQSDVLTLWHALRGSDFELDVDVDKVREAEEVFKECMKSYFLPPEATAVEPTIPWSPMPGGALTANTQMLRDNGIMERYPEIIKAMGEVVRCGGVGTSVTPVSQFYFQQAFNNVMIGPWKKIAEGYGQMVLGYFGRTPVPPDPKVVALAMEQLQLKPTDVPPIEINNADPTKGLEAARKKLKAEGLPETEENLFIVATCKDKGIKFLKGQGELGVRKIVAPVKPETPPPAAPVTGAARYQLTVNHKKFDVAVDDNKVTVNGKVYVVGLQEKAEAPAGGTVAASTPGVGGAAQPVISNMPGDVLAVLRGVGERVAEGDPLFTVEAMKMEMKILAPIGGTLTEIHVAKGAHVTTGQVLATITPG